MSKFIAQSQTTLPVSVQRVWQALTTPAIVKQYMSDTQLQAEWKVGGTITYSGVWKGEPYQDKGKILEIEPNKKLVVSYFSPLSGQADKPENYSTIWYELQELNGQTTLTIKQEADSQEAADSTKNNWDAVLAKLSSLHL